MHILPPTNMYFQKKVNAMDAKVGKTYAYNGYRRDIVQGTVFGKLTGISSAGDSHQPGGKEPTVYLEFSSGKTLQLEWDEKLAEHTPSCW